MHSCGCLKVLLYELVWRLAQEESETRLGSGLGIVPHVMEHTLYGLGRIGKGMVVVVQGGC